MPKLAITSVYANPLHPGHIECLELSKSQTGADELWVIINNDKQAELKRGEKSFQNERFRMDVVGALKPVDRVFLSIDQDKSVCQSLDMVIREAKETGQFDEIIFTKWGDRFASEIPEAGILASHGVRIVDGLGAKTHNSSDFLKLKNKDDETKLKETLEKLPEDHKQDRYLEIGYRPWGVYYVLEDEALFKVKKIIVQPGLRLSLQSHEHRSEHWTVVSGTARVDIRSPDQASSEQLQILNVNESCYIPCWYIHRLINTSSDPVVLIEVQCGDYMGEDDIHRYEDDFWRN